MFSKTILAAGLLLSASAVFGGSFFSNIYSGVKNGAQKKVMCFVENNSMNADMSRLDNVPAYYSAGHSGALYAADITMSVSFSSCTEASANNFVFDLSVELTYAGVPAGEDLIVTLDGGLAQAISSGAASPQSVTFTGITADGSGGHTILAEFETTTSCNASMVVKYPAPCPASYGSPAGEICNTLVASQIGGSVFEDENFNGLLDESETIGLWGVELRAYDCDNVRVGTVFSDSTGNYRFGGLTPGRFYRIEFILPEAISCMACPTHAGADAGTAIQFVQAGGCANLGVADPLEHCQSNPLCDAAPVEIGNYIWCDSIQNGLQDACERSIGGIVVQLYDHSGLLVGQVLTSGGGQYFFNENNVDTTGISVDMAGVVSPATSWSGMGYNASYYIVFGDGQYSAGSFFANGEYYVVTPSVNAGSDDNIDSDVDGAVLTNGISGIPDGLPYINMATGGNGCGSHHFDMGVTCECPTPNAPVISVANNVCPSEMGSFGITTPCRAGSHVEYSTDGGGTWSETVPAWADGVSVMARCVDNIDSTCIGPNSAAVTAELQDCCPTDNCFDIIIQN